MITWQYILSPPFANQIMLNPFVVNRKVMMVNPAIISWWGKCCSHTHVPTQCNAPNFSTYGAWMTAEDPPWTPLSTSTFDKKPRGGRHRPTFGVSTRASLTIAILLSQNSQCSTLPRDYLRSFRSHDALKQLILLPQLFLSLRHRLGSLL